MIIFKYNSLSIQLIFNQNRLCRINSLKPILLAMQPYATAKNSLSCSHYVRLVFISKKTYSTPRKVSLKGIEFITIHMAKPCAATAGMAAFMKATVP